ncbi:DUF1295 domain-containing protein [Tsuneonella mangrovi]|uniref:DUF1295 domain-containing protein n=1 Tax=Tsuneonella mangrovi TaxID=1982042 RepID=UPI000BA1D378|nr:DUF1295 domain-containing protein [Tsuneonella mangrovi]
MIHLLMINAAILVAIVLVLWAISVRIGDVSFVDSFWGTGMALMAIASWLHGPGSHDSALATILLAMTCAWGFRLGIYLYRRWHREGQDPRYERILRKDREKGRFAFAALTKVWLGQAVLLFLVSSPAQAGIIAAGDRPDVPSLALAGIALFLVGIYFEWVGDLQLVRFRADPANAGKVLDSGLWRYTRHPNYFGDACAWWGIWLVAASVSWTVAAWTVVGPLFLTFTLTRWSGKPLLEAGLVRKRPDYAAYVERTSGFIPWPPRKR